MQRNYGDYDHDYNIMSTTCIILILIHVLLYCSVCMPCMFTYF